MKKQALLLAAALVATAASARTLTPDEALARAGGLARSASNPTLVYTGSAVKSADAAVYVFNRGTDEGFLVLSADDNVTPVLGYADEGAFDPFHIPDNMRWWLKSYAEQVKWQAEHPAADARPVFAGNVRTAAADREAIAPMCKTKWDQDAPYYNLCPTINNRRCYTGCVATAISQVMKYHNYPTTGKGTVSVTVNGSNLSMSLSGTTFEWDKMLNYYTSNGYTSAQGTAVATLMKAVGYAVDMSYGTNASGAFSFDIPKALVDNFSYDAGLDYYNRDFYNETEWDEMIYNNLRDCGPVVYGGDSNDGGHSFVCDGYLNGYYHINWGWSGMSDGFFLLSALDPDSQGIGGASSGFNYGQDAVLGIRKPVTGSQKPMRMGVYGDLEASVSGTKLTLNNAINVSGNPFTGCIGVRLVNQSTKAETYVKSMNISNLETLSYYRTWTATLPSSLASGTYKVYPVYATTTSPTTSSWKDMSIMNGSPEYATLTKTGSSYSISVEEIQRFEVTDVKVETDVYVNMPFTLTFTITNPNSFPRMAEIAPSFNRLTARVGYGAGMVINLDANETRTITYSSTLLPTTMGAANCNMYICEEESDGDGNVTAYAISSATVVSVKKVSNPTITITDFNIENPNNVNAASVRGSYTIKSGSSYSAGVIQLVMFDNTTSNQVQSINLPPYYLNAGETKTYNFDVVFSEGLAGQKYMAALFKGSSQVSNVKTVTVEGFVGIDDINAAEVEIMQTEYYNLQGMRVPADRLTPGVYVVRNTDSKGRVDTAKIVVR